MEEEQKENIDQSTPGSAMNKEPKQPEDVSISASDQAQTMPDVASKTQVPEQKMNEAAKLPKKPKTGLLLIIVFLLLLLIGGGGYFAYTRYYVPSLAPQSISSPTASPSPVVDSMSDWESYKNEEFNYAFKYSPEWSIGDETDNYLELIDSNGSKITISATSDFKNPSGCPNPYDESKPILIGNLDLIRGVYKSGDSYIGSVSENETSCWFEKDGVTYSIHFYSGTNIKGIFDQILSTFELTDSTMSDWETYNSNGAKFNYPSSWILDSNGSKISSSDPKIDLLVFDENGAMMNECMQETNKKTSGNLMIKYYSSVQNSAACDSPDNQNQREIWITKAGGDGFAPGIIYSYTTGQSSEAEAVFDQILSTFEFGN